MFRLSHYMRELVQPTPLGPQRRPSGPVVIWNLTRRCNLTCKHCYALAADGHFPGELTTEQAFAVLDDLKAFRVPALILSGGEPLLRPDIVAITRRAKELGFYLTLSTNGTMIDAPMAEQVAAAGYDYVGISLDGIAATHDHFRRQEGAFAASLEALRLLRDRDVRVGVRFTLTQDNAHDLPALLDLVEQERIGKFYLSHLNYAGRGNNNRRDDAFLATTRQAMDLLFDSCLRHVRRGLATDFVTGNNDADGVYLLLWAQRHFPDQAKALRQRLERWGGNATGVWVANIDNVGDVHPDTMWWGHTIGNVKERPFSAIWRDTDDPLMLGLRQSPRPVGGRCATCRHFAICSGNTRVRALQVTGDPWAEDPACYLDDDEIGAGRVPVALRG
jgi:heme d1 biosynthesis radical SAM protein NirJ